MLNQLVTNFRMIVREDDRGRVPGECLLDDFARMNARAVRAFHALMLKTGFRAHE
jgi:hypothetical protein